MSLPETAKLFEAKLKRIKVVALDVDGILTSGHVWWASEEVGFNRTFNIYDGYGMKLLMRAGIKVGVITGGNSVSVIKRTEQLGVDFSYIGNEDKRSAFNDLLTRYNVKPEEILYMGDELFDIPLLKRAGFAATVPSASDEVKEISDYVTIRKSGDGCAREVLDLVRYAQGIFPPNEDF
ncbi:MAG TPA: HAD hydrolase family protein [Bacteriovoracaceae bacterium]|nr:HAD hydrolase family protein [Bacteriovoracaceae bacterium]